MIIEIIITILTHNRTEPKSRTVTKWFFQSALVTSFVVHRCSGREWLALWFVRWSCVRRCTDWSGWEGRRGISLQWQSSSDTTGSGGLAIVSVLSATGNWTASETMHPTMLALLIVIRIICSQFTFAVILNTPCPLASWHSFLYYFILSPIQLESCHAWGSLSKAMLPTPGHFTNPI